MHMCSGKLHSRHNMGEQVHVHVHVHVDGFKNLDGTLFLIIHTHHIKI